MSANGISRVNYFDRQFLRPQDFTDEQAYHVAMHRRHNIAAHIWGIVFGLELTVDSAGNLSILPGMAIDGYGRELILPYPKSLDAKAFDQKGSETLQVWLRYDQLQSDPAAAGYGSCGAQTGPLTRTQELSAVDFLPPDPNLVMDAALNLPEQRQPPGVPPGDLSSDPTRVPSDDPARAWRVYLGLIRRQPGQPPVFTIDLSGRPYAGLVGELIRAPSGRAWMQVGAETKDDPYRFAVYLPEVQDPSTPYAMLVQDCAVSAFPVALLPRFGITSAGELKIRGDTHLDGDLTVDGGAIEFGVGPAVAKPQPWRIYHVETLQDPNTPQGQKLDQLRIEMGSSAAPKGTNQVVIGAWSAKESKFKPCLTIDDNCHVTVHGNLTIEGLLNDKPLAALAGQPALTADARAARTGLIMASLTNELSMMSRPGTGGNVINFTSQSPAPVTSATVNLTREAILESFKTNPQLKQDVIDTLAQDSDARARFAQSSQASAAAAQTDTGVADSQAPTQKRTARTARGKDANADTGEGTETGGSTTPPGGGS